MARAVETGATIQERDMKKWGELVARAWSDDALRTRLIGDTTNVLKEHGIHVPEAVTVRLLEDTPDTRYLVAPRDVRVEVVANTDAVRFLVLPLKPTSKIRDLGARDAGNVKGGAAATCNRCAISPCCRCAML